MSSTCIQCMIRSHHNKQDFFLNLPILDVQKEKQKRGPSTVPHPLHSFSPNISNLNFLAALSLERPTFNQEVKLTRCFKSIDQQNNPF